MIINRFGSLKQISVRDRGWARVEHKRPGEIGFLNLRYSHKSAVAISFGFCLIFIGK